MRRWLAIVALLAACKSKAQRDHERELAEQEEHIAEQIERLEHALEVVDAGPVHETPIPDEPIVIPPAEPTGPETVDAIEQPRPAVPSCIDLDALTSARFTATATRICQDAFVEGASDCITVSRAGQITKVDHTPAPSKPRITLADDVAEICSATRACLRIGPALAIGETVRDVVARDDGALAALLIADTAGNLLRLEVWDLDRGRRQATADVRDLGADAIRSEVEFARGALLLFTDIDDAGLAHDTVFGLDGTRRVQLGGGSGRMRYYATTDRMVAGFDLGTEDLGVITGHDLATGKQVGRRDVTPIDPDLLDMDGAGGHSVVLSFGGAHPHLEVIDLSTGKSETRTVPTCE